MQKIAIFNVSKSVKTAQYYLQNSVPFWLLSNKLTIVDDSPSAMFTEQPTRASTPQSEQQKQNNYTVHIQIESGIFLA